MAIDTKHSSSADPACVVDSRAGRVPSSSPADGGDDLGAASFDNHSRRLIDHARRVSERVATFFSIAATTLSLDFATPAKADQNTATSTESTARTAAAKGWPEGEHFNMQEWRFGLGDSVAVSGHITRGRNQFYGSLDSDHRAGIGFGRTYHLPSDDKISHTYMTPTAVFYTQRDHGARLDLILDSRLWASEPKRVAERNTTAFDLQSGIVMQAGGPTLVHIDQRTTIYDREARRLRPREEGIRVVVEYGGPDAFEHRHSERDDTPDGQRYKVDLKGFRTEQWAFAKWHLGPGLIETDLGLTKKRAEVIGTRTPIQPDSTGARTPEEFKLTVLKPSLMWRIQYILKR